ncbi:MAG: hypothetical protein J6W53_04695 [Candidatus Methanomethylophilaceae archaeon]|nr:hypothetical protein [Candidatus Methanomethylophilaceae archaeon]
MAEIGMETVLSSILVVVMMLVILSVPSILLTVRNSAKLLKKYRLLRSIDISDKDDVPQQVLNEWNAANSQMAYTTLITDEIEKLTGLRPAIFQCEIAIILMIILLLVPPGCTLEVLILMIVLIAVSAFAVIYGALNTRMYTIEYVKILSEINAKNESENKTADGMYG